MKQISSIDLFYLTKEFKAELENQRIDSFYYTNETFYMKFYIKRKGGAFLTNKIGKYIYLGTEKQESLHPVNFIQYLRKYLKSSYLIEINQIESERILELNIEKKDAETQAMIKYKLIIEMFSNGNIILCDENYNILNSLIKKKFKDRKIIVKEHYELPPKKELTIFNIDKALFAKQLKEEKDFNISAFLATRFGIGGKFAKQICETSKVDKLKYSQDLTKEEIDKIITNLKELTKQEIKAFAILKSKDSKEITDFIPFEFIGVQDNQEKQQLDSFNEVINKYYSQFLIKEDKTEEKLEKELAKLNRIIESQEKNKEKILIDYQKNNEIGNKIYENYSIIEELLNSINQAAKDKGWQHVEKIIKNNEKLNKIIHKLDYKNNEITLNLE